MIVNHINGNKLDAYYKNLIFCTHSENSAHSVGKKISMIDKKTNTLIANFDSIALAVKYCDKLNYGCRRSAISAVVSGKFKSYRGFLWKIQE